MTDLSPSEITTWAEVEKCAKFFPLELREEILACQNLIQEPGGNFFWGLANKIQDKLDLCNKLEVALLEIPSIGPERAEVLLNGWIYIGRGGRKNLLYTWAHVANIILERPSELASIPSRDNLAKQIRSKQLNNAYFAKTTSTLPVAPKIPPRPVFTANSIKELRGTIRAWQSL